MGGTDKNLVGVVLAGRYRITRELAAGGMGAVYEAEQLGLGRSVAVKVMHPLLAEDDEAITRFEREARIVAAIGHANVVQIIDFHRAAPGEMAWIVMELARGRSLSQVLKEEGALTPARVTSIVLSLLSALEAAHAAGVVHRDLKPGNVMIASVPGADDAAKLLDFGIAKLTEGAGYTKLTRTGVVIGTPQFMAPEQARAELIDQRTDLYAVGVMCWAMLAGRLPFPRGSMADVIEGVLHTTPARVSTLRGDVGPALDAFVARAMAKSPADRYQSAREMADALRATRAEAISDARIERSTAVRTQTLAHASAPRETTSAPGTRPLGTAGAPTLPEPGSVTRFPVTPTAFAAPSVVASPAATPPGLEAPRAPAARSAWPALAAIGVGCAGLGAVALAVTAIGAAYLVVRATDAPASPSVAEPVAPHVQPLPMPPPTTASPPSPPPPVLTSTDAGPPYDITHGTMQFYLTDATRIARDIAPDARLMLVLGICVAPNGRISTDGGADCGWKIQFVRPHGGDIIVIEYGRMQTAAHVGGTPFEPDDPPLESDVLPDSDAVMAAALRSPACAGLDYRVRVLWRNDPRRHDFVLADSDRVHDWAAAIHDGALQRRFQDCQR